MPYSPPVIPGCKQIVRFKHNGIEAVGLLRGTCYELRYWDDILANDPCPYCYGKSDSIEHLVPKKAGGANSWENCVAACKQCNMARSSVPLLHYLWFIHANKEADKEKVC